MKRHIRCLILLAGGAFALVLAGCGSGVDASADAVPEAVSAEATSEEAQDSTVEVEDPQEQSDSDEVDEPEEAEEVEDVVEVVEFTGDALTVAGEATAWVPGCNVGLPVSAGEGDCESVGGFTILPVTFSSQLSGTLDGSYTQHARYAVSPDGDYVFASVDTFVGTVGECGEGTIVFNSAGSGTFDTVEPASDIPISSDVSWISYTTVESRLSTLDAVLSSTTSTETGATSFDTTGTINCGDGESVGDLVLTARPESSVDPADALDAAGTATFAVNADCNVLPGSDSPTSCPSVDGFYVQGLNNSLTLDGAIQGDVRFITANLVDSAQNWEHSGIVIFEGTVEGCGEGAAVYVNEAAGNNRQAGFFHVRSFTPQGFDSGPLDLSIDTSTRLSGFVRATSEGSYSCG